LGLRFSGTTKKSLEPTSLFWIRIAFLEALSGLIIMFREEMEPSPLGDCLVKLEMVFLAEARSEPALRPVCNGPRLEFND
jgi:hypothetical protein